MNQYEHLEFHNVAALEPFGSGWMLPRYPATVRSALSDRGRWVSLDSCGVEIRFVTPAPTIRITLSCHDADGEATVYCGSFVHSTHVLPQGVHRTLLCARPTSFDTVTPEVLGRGGFAPTVWRIVFSRGTGLFHGLETFGQPVRPPTRAELPPVKWLAYGSSITHANLAGYVFHAARLLHWDVLDKGLGGACQIEAEVAEYLATGCAWDIATLELGVNMCAQFAPEEFRQRAQNLVQHLRATHPRQPIVLISPFHNDAHHARTATLVAERQRAYDGELRQLATTAGDANLHLIEGMDLLPDFTLLTADLVHPTPSGHALMGHLLADRLRSIGQSLITK